MPTATPPEEKLAALLLERVAQEPRIHLQERVTMRDLVVRDGRVIGVEALDEHNRPLTFLGSGVLLASGGAGQVYSDTTNPAWRPATESRWRIGRAQKFPTWSSTSFIRRR